MTINIEKISPYIEKAHNDYYRLLFMSYRSKPNPMQPNDFLNKYKKTFKPNSQLSYVLYKLVLNKKPITAGDFEGYPRISEYIRRLRKDYNLDIQTIPIKFTTRFGTKSEYASYKLKSPIELAVDVFKKIIEK